MIDRCGRNIDYLRISVTDRCNLRCIYCMPEEGVQHVERSLILQEEEILRICRVMAELGIRKIKLTGGEPLVRPRMPQLVEKLKNMPNNLSGGQQQRVAIARALITKPAIVLADEPTGNLDSKTSAEVLGLIKRTSAEFRQTVVMITHNNDIARLADRIVRIEDGKIVE